MVLRPCPVGVSMLLTLHERERLMIYTAAKLAAERKECGVKLNLPEATALITSFLLEGARDGRSGADLMESGRDVLSRADVMDGVPEMLAQLQMRRRSRTERTSGSCAPLSSA